MRGAIASRCRADLLELGGSAGPRTGALGTPPPGGCAVARPRRNCRPARRRPPAGPPMPAEGGVRVARRTAGQTRVRSGGTSSTLSRPNRTRLTSTLSCFSRSAGYQRSTCQAEKRVRFPSPARRLDGVPVRRASTSTVRRSSEALGRTGQEAGSESRRTAAGRRLQGSSKRSDAAARSALPASVRPPSRITSASNALPPSGGSSSANPQDVVVVAAPHLLRAGPGDLPLRGLAHGPNVVRTSLYTLSSTGDPKRRRGKTRRRSRRWRPGVEQALDGVLVDAAAGQDLRLGEAGRASPGAGEGPARSAKAGVLRSRLCAEIPPGRALDQRSRVHESVTDKAQRDHRPSRASLRPIGRGRAGS